MGDGANFAVRFRLQTFVHFLKIAQRIHSEGKVMQNRRTVGNDRVARDAVRFALYQKNLMMFRRI